MSIKSKNRIKQTNKIFGKKEAHYNNIMMLRELGKDLLNRWVFRDRQNDFVELEDFKLLGRLFHNLGPVGVVVLMVFLFVLCCCFLFCCWYSLLCLMESLYFVAGFGMLISSLFLNTY